MSLTKTLPPSLDTILMKPKNYRLQAVLKVRESARDEAGRTVSRRLDELESAQYELNRRQNDLLACYEKQDQKQFAMNELLEAGALIRSVVEHRTFLGELRESERQLKEVADKQKKSVVRAEKELETARDALIDATRDFKAIETHRSKWTATQRKAASRLEQKASDEISSILHQRRVQE